MNRWAKSGTRLVVSVDTSFFEKVLDAMHRFDQGENRFLTLIIESLFGERFKFRNDIFTQRSQRWRISIKDLNIQHEQDLHRWLASLVHQLYETAIIKREARDCTYTEFLISSSPVGISDRFPHLCVSITRLSTNENSIHWTTWKGLITASFVL